MANASLNDLKKKHNVQNLIKIWIKMKELLVKLNPAIRRFYRKQLETLRMYILPWEKRYFPSTLGAIAVGFHWCASIFMWYHQIIPVLLAHCHHHFYDPSIILYASVQIRSNEIKNKAWYFAVLSVERKTISQFALYLFHPYNGEGKWVMPTSWMW